MNLTFNLLNASGAELAAGSEKIMSVTDIACIGLVGVAYFAFFFMLLRYILIPRIAKARPGGGQGGWDWVENHLSAMFCVVWFYGFITYFIGTFGGCRQLGALPAVGRAYGDNPCHGDVCGTERHQRHTQRPP